MRCNIPYPDLYARLEGTVCLYDGKPYVVRTNGQTEEEDGASGTIFLYDMVEPTHHVMTIQSDDPLFDVATPPMGYVQVLPDKIAYVTRRPWRKWKQGIIWDALYIDDLAGGRDHFGFNSDAFRDTMAQNWQPLRYYLARLAKAQRNYAEVAVSNEVCLQLEFDNVNVIFRQEKVGTTKKGDLLSDRPIIEVPTSRKSWVVKKYLQDFNFEIVIK